MALTTEQIEALEALAKKHGALSYRNRADTQNPAFGFGVEGLAALLAEARRDALEEAAKKCETMHEEDRPGDYAYAIRAMKETTQ